MMRFCSFSGCDNPPSPKAAKGLCNSHYWQLHKGRELTPLSYRRNRCVPWIEAHIDYQGDDCLVWPFQRLSDGRGGVKYKGRQSIASRVVCEMAHGPAPSETHEAAHSCGKGNQGCVNPRHLRWATPKENAADKIKHGTVACGERQGGSKLKTEQVRLIRLNPWRVSQSKIALMFGVGQGTIGKIIRRERWGHI